MSQQTPTDAEATILASEFIRVGDKTKAFKVAFPKSKASNKTKNEKASLVFNHAKVLTRIEELKGISKKNSEEEFTMSVSSLKKILTKAMKVGLESGKPSAAVAAVREFNCMDGNHSAIKIHELVDYDIPEDSTPQDASNAYLDAMKNES